jgi:hypothetical protein
MSESRKLSTESGQLQVVGYVFLVLTLGAGLVVNAVLENGFGRARRRNVVQFGGEQQFTPAFVVSEECATKYSFSRIASGAHLVPDTVVSFFVI